MGSQDRYTRYPRSILWLVPGGESAIGGTEPDAKPSFRVEIEPFYVSKWPITNQQYQAFDPGFERSPLSPADRDTAVGVSWEEALAYCRWYAGVSRKPIRLPGEVEWEYACRGGAETRYFWGDDPSEADLYLWDSQNSGGRVQPPDGKKANGFGIHGTLGGVWEWTSSAYLPYPLAESQAASPEEAGERILRGGSFRLHRSDISCSLRRPAPQQLRAEDIGFRIARSFH